MTAPSLLDELEGVVRLSNEADRLPYGEGRAYAYRDATVRALNFVLGYRAEIAAMANELRVARESFKRCDEICKCTAENWRTAEEDMAKRLKAAERKISRLTAMRNEWERDAREHLMTFGQHLPASVECLVEQFDAAIVECQDC